MGVIWTPGADAPPSGGVPTVAWGNPSSRALAVAVSGANPGINLVNGRGAVAHNAVQRTATQFGPGLTWPSTSNIGVQIGPGSLLPGSAGNYTSGMTLILLANPSASTTRTLPLSLSSGAQPTIYVGFNANKALTATSGMLMVQTHGNNGAQAASVIDGKWHVFAVVFPEGSALPLLYVDGVHVTASSSGSASTYANAAANVYVGGFSSSGFSATGYAIALALGFNRGIPAEEMAELSGNLWQLIEAENDPVFYSLGGGGAAALAGAATGGASAAGALSTAIPILGAAVSGATASGSLSTAISLAGATATISATATGALSATIRLAGDAVAGAIAAGGLSTGIPLVGDGSGGGAGTGDLATGSGLAGSGAAGAAGTGVLTTQITLSGAAIAQAIASGALTTTPAGLAGDGASSSSGSGALSTGIPLAGAAAVSVVGAGGLVTAIALAGAATAAVSATGDLVVSLGLAGAALISAIGSGALLASITLNGAAVTGAVGAGALSGAALHASPWRTVTSLARVRSVRATARVRRCIAGVR